MQTKPDVKGKSNAKVSLFLDGKLDATFLIIVLVLLSIGLIMMFSASYASAYYYEGNSLHYIARQLPFAMIGIVFMLVASRVNYHAFRVLSWPIYLFSVLLLILVLFTEDTTKGVRRWIYIGSFSFQPSEIAKFAIVILFAHLIVSYGPAKMRTFRYGICPFVVILAPVVFLMIKEPHLSGTLLICAFAAVMLFIGGTHYIYFAIGVGIVLTAMGAVVINPDLLTTFAKYAGTRIEVWLDPTSDPLGAGFQTLQSLYAIGSGGLMGTGIGGSRQKYLYLPEPYNDFIFAIVCEELGFIGAALVICLFGLLVWRGFVIAARCKSRFGSLIAAGLTAQVGIQTILNIAVVTNTMPNTGISLPFFSYGGTSLVMLLAEMGIVLAVSRDSIIEKE